jgi:hypothetical protein
MVRPHSEHIRVSDGIAASLKLMRDRAESIRYSITASRRTLEEAREAINAANAVLTWRLSDGN